MARGGVQFPIDRVHLEITNACNFDCTFCPEGIMTRPLGVMRPDAFARIAEQLAAGPLVNRVMLHLMGEPLLHPDFLELVRIGVDHGLFLHLTTNGSRLEPDAVDALLTAGLGEITLSLQTPDAESFAASRGTTMPWAEYAEGVTRLAARATQIPDCTPVTVDMLITARQPLMLPTKQDVRWLMDAPQLRAVLAHWTRHIYNGGWAGAEAEPFDLPAALARCAEASINRWNVIPIHPRVQFETRQLGDWANAFAGEGAVRPARVGACNTLQEQFGILWNGDVVLCCADYDGKTAMGNALETPLRSILEGDRCGEIRAGFDRLRVVHDHCRTCLGGTSRTQAALHQVGSILYHRAYKRWFRDGSGFAATLAGPTAE